MTDNVGLVLKLMASLKKTPKPVPNFTVSTEPTTGRTRFGDAPGPTLGAARTPLTQR